MLIGFAVNDTLSCMYHGKMRRGTVEAIAVNKGRTIVTLRMGDSYRSMFLDEMRAILVY